jgi:hypothetical protein
MKQDNPPKNRTAAVLSSAIALLSFAWNSIAAAQPVFIDVTEQAGVTYQQMQSLDSANLEIDGVTLEMAVQITGGAAAGDYDGDGNIDLFVTRFDAPDILFRNRGDGAFEDVTDDAGLASFDLASNGAGFGDIDNDGDLDLYVSTTGKGRHYLFINDGQGRFTEEAVERNADIESPHLRWGFSVAFGDYDRDGWLDIYVGEWRQSRIAGSCPPSHARLLRNRGADSPGAFEDVTFAVGVDLDGVVIGGVGAFAPAFSDLDNDGWPDLAIMSDFGSSRLFWNNGDGTFTDGTESANVGSENSGMGSTIGDFDNDGDLDWFATAIHHPPSCFLVGWDGNRMHRNEGGRLFSNRIDEVGVRDGDWGWGAAFFDYDNDGDLDLIMTNGVHFSPDFTDDPMHLWRNDDGVFTEISEQAGITDRGAGKGLLTFDYDNDGDLDVFVVNTAATPILYRNDGGNEHSWLRIRPTGGRSNRSALGAKVTLTLESGGPSQFREINSSSFFQGQGETIAHFGLGAGDAPVSEVRIEWPLGGETVLTDIACNTTLMVVEPDSGLPPAPTAGRPVPTEPVILECGAEPIDEVFEALGRLPDEPPECELVWLCPLSGFLGLGVIMLALTGTVVGGSTRRRP